MGTTPVQIDFEAIKHKVASITPEDRAKKLAEFRTRQVLQQKKQAAKGGQAAYNKKRNEEFKQMKALALETPATNPPYKNQWEEIEAQAQSEADGKFDKWIDEENEKAGVAIDDEG